MQNAALIERFYEAFARRDADAMGACYADDVVFSDPVFPRLEGERARAMWRMLCERGTDLEVSVSGIAADGDAGRAHWEARYTFSGSGRRVHNRIDATFRFRAGLIVEHTDAFSLWRWSAMALGPVGALLGWSPPVRGKIRALARKSLDRYLSSDSSAGGPAAFGRPDR